MSNMGVFNGMFGKVKPGCCRLSPNGKIAVKTSNGYKTYNVKTGRLTNCANFALDIGEDLFFIMPTNKVKIGDIILVGGTPRCVIKADKNEIIALNYENSTKETIIPERHVFMGKNYMYGKIISLMGNMAKGNGLMKYMMMSEILKGMNGGNSHASYVTPNPMANMLGDGSNPMQMFMFMSLLNGNDMFEGMFDMGDEMEDIFNFGDDDEAADDEEEEA